MPCSDGRDYNDCSEYQRRNDELARRLCRLGGITLKLMKGEFVSHDDRVWAFGIHKEHREADKRRELKIAKDAALTLDANILKIKALDGEPKQELIDNYERAKARAFAIANSDPLDTDLY